MKNIWLMIILVFLSHQVIAQNQLLEDYLSLKNALVKSDKTNSVASAKTLLQGLKKADLSEANQTLLSKTIQQLIDAPTLDKQRAAFAELSPMVWKIIQESADVKGTIYYMYCPMKKAYWISIESSIKNPYYGTQMLNCGNIAKQKN